MAKTLSLVIFLLLVVSVLPSCKKCFTCTNACSTCVKRDSAGAVIEQRTLYSDSLYYTALKTTLTQDSGYICTKGPSTYSVDYCVNTKDASAQYMVYFEGDGRYTCNAK